MRFSVLGPLEVTDDGARLDLGGRQPRIVLAALVAARGQPVTADALIDAIWGDDPPRTAAGTLQSYISRLRRRLDEHDGPSLTLDPSGYRLDLTGHELDLDRFDQLVAEGEAHLAAGRPAEASEALRTALALWRGDALADLVVHSSELLPVAALDERRLAALEQRIEADLALGRHRDVIGELRTLVERHALRESLHAKLALALYRSDRQADAVRALADAGRTLREELGLEPSRQLAELEAAILAQDPSLDVGAAPATARAPGSAPATTSAAPAPQPATPTPGTAAARPTSPGIEATPATSGVPLVGRDAELAELLAALREAADDARFVVIEGEAGVGKTRLAEELTALARQAGSLVAWGRSDESGAAPALWPWLPVLRATIEVAVDEVPEPLADVLAGASPLVAGQGGAVRYERFDAVADLLERAGKEQVAVVVLDDLQWADPTSLELLEFLTTRLTRGVLVVGTVRALEVGHTGPVTDALAATARRPGTRRLPLRGLGATATGDLLHAVRDEVTPELVARIHERSDGNPFYAIELARLLDQDQPGEVPASVRDAIRRRLGQLPADTLETLNLAAVVGRDVDVPLVARAGGLDLGECLDRLEPAAAHRVLGATPAAPAGLSFSHALVREVLLDDLTAVRRARLHLAVADAMAEAAGGDDAVDRDDAEALAGHLWRSVSLGHGERAAAALERAAETAISRVAYVEAETLLRRAQQLRRSARATPEAKQAELATLLRLLEVMQATRYFAGTDRDDLTRALQLATELDAEDVLRKAAWSEWGALSTGGHLAECRPLAEAYLARWGDDPRPQVQAAAHTLYGVDEWTYGRIDRALEHLDLAVGLLADAPPPADAFEGEYTVIAHAFSLYCHAARGDLSVDDAMAGFDGLLAMVPPPVVPGVCSFAAATAAVHHHWDHVERLVDRAFEADPAAQFAFFGGQLLMMRGVVTAARGDLDGGLATFLDGRSRYEAVGGHSTIETYQASIAELLARAGRVEEAEELLADARRLFDVEGAGPDEMPLLTAEGLVAALAGDHERAAERLGTAVEVGTAKGSHAFAARAEAVAEELSVPLAGARAGAPTEAG